MCLLPLVDQGLQTKPPSRVNPGGGQHGPVSVQALGPQRSQSPQTVASSAHAYHSVDGHILLS